MIQKKIIFLIFLISLLFNFAIIFKPTTAYAQCNYPTQEECMAADCRWYDNSCHVDYPLSAQLRHNDFIQEAWKYVLAVLNGVVVLGLIIVALANILRINIEAYHIKRMLPAIILGVILANFSYLICRVFVDFAQVAADFFLGRPSPDAILTIFGLEGIKGTPSGLNTYFKIFTTVNLLMLNLSSLLILFLLILILIAPPTILMLLLGFLLAVRIYLIWFLVIVSPIAWFSLSFTPLGKVWQMWWSWFIKWLLLAPLAFLFIRLAIIVSSTPWPQGVGGGFAKWFFGVVLFALAIYVPFIVGGKIVSVWSNLWKAGAGLGLKGLARGTSGLGLGLRSWGENRAKAQAKALGKSIDEVRAGRTLRTLGTGLVGISSPGAIWKKREEYMASQRDKALTEGWLGRTAMTSSKADVEQWKAADASHPMTEDPFTAIERAERDRENWLNPGAHPMHLQTFKNASRVRDIVRTNLAKNPALREAVRKKLEASTTPGAIKTDWENLLNKAFIRAQSVTGVPTGPVSEGAPPGGPPGGGISVDQIRGHFDELQRLEGEGKTNYARQIAKYYGANHEEILAAKSADDLVRMQSERILKIRPDFAAQAERYVPFITHLQERVLADPASLNEMQVAIDKLRANTTDQATINESYEVLRKVTPTEKVEIGHLKDRTDELLRELENVHSLGKVIQQNPTASTDLIKQTHRINIERNFELNQVSQNFSDLVKGKTTPQEIEAALTPEQINVKIRPQIRARVQAYLSADPQLKGLSDKEIDMATNEVVDNAVSQFRKLPPDQITIERTREIVEKPLVEYTQSQEARVRMTSPRTTSTTSAPAPSAPHAGVHNPNAPGVPTSKEEEKSTQPKPPAGGYGGGGGATPAPPAKVPAPPRPPSSGIKSTPQRIADLNKAAENAHRAGDYEQEARFINLRNDLLQKGEKG